MRLSVRLEAVARLAADAVFLADIGTDHGYIPIYLAEKGSMKGALAMDINPGPLMRAKENILVHGLQNRIRTRLSDGAKELRPGEADTVVIAGMGGNLTVRILADSEEVLKSVDTFVLQPQSEIEKVRRYLHEHGFCIEAEDMVKDEGKYYPMMRAVHGSQKMWDLPGECYGKYLIEQKNPVLKEFLQKEEKKCIQIAAALKKSDSDRGAARLKVLEEELEVIGKTLSTLKL